MFYGRRPVTCDADPDPCSAVCLQSQTGKSGGSCSDGSMLSIYSSGTGTGTDDDIFGPLSENSSRLSLSRDQGNSSQYYFTNFNSSRVFLRA